MSGDGVSSPDVPAGEARKVVSVLFCDLVGYTSRGEGLDPEALRRLQQGYFDAARATLERHGGTVEKFIGDAVMAVFGLPLVHEDDALRYAKAEAAAALAEVLARGGRTGEAAEAASASLREWERKGVLGRVEAVRAVLARLGSAP